MQSNLTPCIRLDVRTVQRVCTNYRAGACLYLYVNEYMFVHEGGIRPPPLLPQQGGRQERGAAGRGSFPGVCLHDRRQLSMFGD